MAPTCQSLSLSSPCATQFAVWRRRPPEAPRFCGIAVVEDDPVFPAGVVAKSSTTPSRARHLPHFPLRLALLSFSFLCSPWTASEQFLLIGRFASSAPRISNPPQPKLDNLPSFLLDPSFASLIDQIAGNRSFSGRQPLKPAELHSAVELLPRVPVLFA